MPIPTIAKPKTVAEWRNLILESLGGEGWNVELSEQNLDHAIYRALTLFSKYTPIWDVRPLGPITIDLSTVVVGKIAKVFDFSDEPEGKRVVDVKFQRNTIKYYSPFHRPFTDEYRGLREPRRVYKNHVANDRHNHFLGSNPTWQWDETSRQLFISAPSPLIGVNAAALLLSPWDIEKIPYHQEYDFLEAAIGFSKQILARILGKFGDIPASQGGISFDASELRSEGFEQVKEIESKLDRSLVGKLPPRSIF